MLLKQNSLPISLIHILSEVEQSLIIWPKNCSFLRKKKKKKAGHFDFLFLEATHLKKMEQKQQRL